VDPWGICVNRSPSPLALLLVIGTIWCVSMTCVVGKVVEVGKAVDAGITWRRPGRMREGEVKAQFVVGGMSRAVACIEYCHNVVNLRHVWVEDQK
jgi:hypothetical protein